MIITLLLIAYLLYGASVGEWIGDNIHLIAHYALRALDSACSIVFSFKRVLRAAH